MSAGSSTGLHTLEYSSCCQAFLAQGSQWSGMDARNIAQLTVISWVASQHGLLTAVLGCAWLSGQTCMRQSSNKPHTHIAVQNKARGDELVRSSFFPQKWMAHVENLTTLLRVRDAINNRLVTKYATHWCFDTEWVPFFSRFIDYDNLWNPFILGTEFIEQNIQAIFSRLRKNVYQEDVPCTADFSRPTSFLACRTTVPGTDIGKISLQGCDPASRYMWRDTGRRGPGRHVTLPAWRRSHRTFDCAVSRRRRLPAASPLSCPKSRSWSSNELSSRTKPKLVRTQIWSSQYTSEGRCPPQSSMTIVRGTEPLLPRPTLLVTHSRTLTSMRPLNPWTSRFATCLRPVSLCIKKPSASSVQRSTPMYLSQTLYPYGRNQTEPGRVKGK